MQTNNNKKAPLTEKEKLSYTLEVQTQKAIEELLSDAFYVDKYEGFLDIWPEEMKVDDNKTSVLKIEFQSKKVKSIASPQEKPNAIRFHISQSKGVKRITSMTQ